MVPPRARRGGVYAAPAPGGGGGTRRRRPQRRSVIAARDNRDWARGNRTVTRWLPAPAPVI